MEANSFNQLNVSEELLKAIAEMGFEEMTEVQQKAIPIVMEGADLTAKAPTGTGKTCAFGVPIIEKTNTDSKELQTIVLCPTRELATQIGDELRSLAKHKPNLRIVVAYGGQPIVKQINALKNFPQIVVATPGRLLDHINRRTIHVNKVTTMVLDECDEMLDMGFMKDVRKIIDLTPKSRQLVMFSATISREVMDISWLYQHDPVEITVEAVEESRPNITQYSIESVGRQKLDDATNIIKGNGYSRVMIFVNTKYMADSLERSLGNRGLSIRCLHGDMVQSMRNKVMNDFKNGSFEVLVSTDVAARGIDVEDVDAVINYELPQDNAYYIHRIGRTGRAKKGGTAYSFVTPDDQKRLKEIIRYTRSEIRPASVDESGAVTEL